MADQEQFLRLYLATEADLKAFLRVLVRDRRDFEDVVQAVALTLWRKFDSYDPARPFGAWARGVAAKEVLVLHRERSRRPTPFSPEVIAVILDAFEQRLTARSEAPEQLDALAQCLEALPADARQLLELRYGRALPLAEVAQHTARTLASTQKTLSRLRLRLGDCIRRRLAPREEPA